MAEGAKLSLLKEQNFVAILLIAFVATTDFYCVAHSSNDVIEDIRQCTFASINEAPFDIQSYNEPSIIRSTTPFVELFTILNEAEVWQLECLEKCVRKVPNHFQDRRFGDGKPGSYGGNNVTYMGGALQEILPELEARFRFAANLALRENKLGRDLDVADSLGFRCIEFLKYEEGGSLNYHQDTDSYFTMIIALSESDEFLGGQFKIKTEEGQLLLARPERKNGILFKSELNHGVESIDFGVRRVLVFELWPFRDSTFDQLRPHKNVYVPEQQHGDEHDQEHGHGHEHGHENSHDHEHGHARE